MVATQGDLNGQLAQLFLSCAAAVARHLTGAGLELVVPGQRRLVEPRPPGDGSSGWTSRIDAGSSNVLGNVAEVVRLAPLLDASAISDVDRAAEDLLVHARGSLPFGTIALAGSRHCCVR